MGEQATTIVGNRCEGCGRLLPLRPCCDHPLARILCANCYRAQQDGADPIRCIHKTDESRGS